MIDDYCPKQMIEFDYMRKCDLFHFVLVFFLGNLLDFVGPAVDLEIVVVGIVDLLFGGGAQDSAKMTTCGQALHLNRRITT